MQQPYRTRATEGANNLIKRIKRAGFGFRRFAYYRVRALLYAGKPNWDLLATITPRLTQGRVASTATPESRQITTKWT